eukprot:Amastigsp_a851941_16.p5 type:complete len:107 gc:universal Amastigsp_a851941_16:329-9(-)
MGRLGSRDRHHQRRHERLRRRAPAHAAGLWRRALCLHGADRRSVRRPLAAVLPRGGAHEHRVRARGPPRDRVGAGRGLHRVLCEQHWHPRERVERRMQWAPEHCRT